MQCLWVCKLFMLTAGGSSDSESSGIDRSVKAFQRQNASVDPLGFGRRARTIYVSWVAENQTMKILSWPSTPPTDTVPPTTSLASRSPILQLGPTAAVRVQ